jgi:alpha-amylase
MLRSYKLSDDIAFRFSNRTWEEWPLDADKFTRWINDLPESDEVVGLFMDFETFGEHQWEDTGIFEFMRHLPGTILEEERLSFALPSEVAANVDPIARLDAVLPVSWADAERDLTAWLGNPMQRAAHEALYDLAPLVRATGDPAILETWRKLTTSDHFYYMCVKFFSDGDVHKYFSPYSSPYDAYITLMNVMGDLRQRIGAPAGLTSPQ